MEKLVRELFERYAKLNAEGLAGTVDLDEVAGLYASDFISATPAGVLGGKNDAALKDVMAKGFERQRAIGTGSMVIRHLRMTMIDDLHCIAHVAWTGAYARPEGPDVKIDFEVHYLVQVINGAAKVFGWISGDETAVLKQHGIG